MPSKGTGEHLKGSNLILIGRRTLLDFPHILSFGDPFWSDFNPYYFPFLWMNQEVEVFQVREVLRCEFL